MCFRPRRRSAPIEPALLHDRRVAGLGTLECRTRAESFGVRTQRSSASTHGACKRGLGHKRIDETMLYVHVAEAHHRQIRSDLLAAWSGEGDPDRRIVAMLGARGNVVAAEVEEVLNCA